MTKEELRIHLESVIDPSLSMTLKEAQAILKCEIDDQGIADLTIALKNRKKDENTVKLAIVKLVKIKLSLPGIRIDFTDNKLIEVDGKNIFYIGVASGKGGVGKSSVVANLALAFQRLGKNVGIIDADIHGSSIPAIFKLPIEPLSTTEDDQLIPALYDNVQIISPAFFMPKNQPLMWRGPMLGKLLTHFFEEVLWDPDIEVILIDLPPGTGDVALDVQSFVPKAKMLIVTTPHPNASQIAVKAGLGAQEIGHQVVGVIENMSYYYHQDTQERIEIFGAGGGQEVAKLLNVDLLSQIPINQPLNKEAFVYNLEDMNGKIYLALAQKLLTLS